MGQVSQTAPNQGRTEDYRLNCNITSWIEILGRRQILAKLLTECGALSVPITPIAITSPRYWYEIGRQCSIVLLLQLAVQIFSPSNWGQIGTLAGHWIWLESDSYRVWGDWTIVEVDPRISNDLKNYARTSAVPSCHINMNNLNLSKP